jgi:hypothetical protein
MLLRAFGKVAANQQVLVTTRYQLPVGPMLAGHW